MASIKDPVLVVLQLSGANDYLHTIVPYNNPYYRDARPNLGLSEDVVLHIDDKFAFNPHLEPIKALYDEGKVAIIHGIGYPNMVRSHFRSLDIWHTCEPDTIGTEGWIGRVIQELDPRGEVVVKGANFGQGLPRAMAKQGVPVTSVSDLGSYGVLTDVPGVTSEQDRARVVEEFARMYAPAIGTGPVMDYLSQTGRSVLMGADILKTAPQKYSSTMEYASTPIAKNLRDIAQVHLADLGTQIFYTQFGTFDTHMGQMVTHRELWTDVSRAVTDFFDDLREHNASDNVVMIMFTEFGRRVRDNGTGTDHGAGGVAFAIGDPVRGGMYGEMPSLKPEDLQFGDVVPNYDFRGFYSTLVEKWLGLDPVPIVGGEFEQFDLI